MEVEVIVALPLLVGGTYVTAGAIYNIWGGKSSTRWGWLTAPGTILSSDVQKDFERGATTYRAEVSYRYEVGGREYVCNRVFFGDEPSSTPAIRLRPGGLRGSTGQART